MPRIWKVRGETTLPLLHFGIQALLTRHAKANVRVEFHHQFLTNSTSSFSLQEFTSGCRIDLLRRPNRVAGESAVPRQVVSREPRPSPGRTAPPKAGPAEASSGPRTIVNSLTLLLFRGGLHPTKDGFEAPPLRSEEAMFQRGVLGNMM